MRTIAIMNLKGGVGKTTTVINVAAILAKDYKQRVLVIDADSQANLSEFFGAGDEGEGKGLSDLLREAELGTTDEVERYICPGNFSGVDLISGDVTLMDLDLTKVELGTVRMAVLRDVREYLERTDAYDWCLIDCPPAFNAPAAAALVAADEVIIPIKLDAFSLRGMANLLQQVKNMQRINPNLRLLGCLPTMWYPSTQNLEADRLLRDCGQPVFPAIRRTDKVDEMTYAQEPLVISSPRSAAGVDYRKFVRLLMGGCDNG